MSPFLTLHTQSQFHDNISVWMENFCSAHATRSPGAARSFPVRGSLSTHYFTAPGVVTQGLRMVVTGCVHWLAPGQYRTQAAQDMAQFVRSKRTVSDSRTFRQFTP